MDAVEIATAEESHNEDTIEETVPEVCRVCLLGHVIMRDLFVENEVVSLSTKAMSFASVKMLPEDGLPGQVCCECADKLEAAYEFKLQVEQADNVLRQRYDTLNIKEELFFNEVEVHLESDRGHGVHSLDVDAHYQATVDSLNAVEPEDEKPSLLKDHLALLEVEKLAKEQDELEAENKNVVSMEEESEVGEILRGDDDHADYLRDDDGNVEELVDYGDTEKTESMHVPEGVTVEEHNYIMQQGYSLAPNEEELGTRESCDSAANDESVNYLSLMEDDMSVEDDPNESEILNSVDPEEQDEKALVKEEISPCETRRSKRKLTKRLRDTDEDNYFENLNLSSRLKRSQTIEKSDKFYFLCYLCDKQFVSKEILKEHMHSHEEVRRTMSLKKNEKGEKRLASPTKTPTAPTTTTSPSSAGQSMSGKKANKCPYCGKEYLYVISFNKHLKQHEKNKESSTGTWPEEPMDTAEDSSSDFVGYDETRVSEATSRVEASNDDVSIDLNAEETSPGRRHARRRSIRNETPAFTCEKCPERFANKRDLAEHAIDHCTTFKCSTCDREFDGLEKLRRHRTEHVVEGVLSEQDLEGNVYEREFDEEAANDADNEIFGEMGEGQSEDVGSQEQVNEADGENNWRLVGIEGDDSADGKGPLVQETDEPSTENVPGNWPETRNLRCPHCSIYCSSKKSLARHIETHEACRQVCKLCKMEFPRKEQLQRHIEQHHSGRTKSFNCTDCGKVFGNELTLRNHLFATNHKTIMHGQQYDPNKRLKRVAAKAAQRIIDKIKTEDDMDEEETDRIDEEERTEENDGETMEGRNSRSSNARWSRQVERQQGAASRRKVQQHRGRRRCDYECEACGRKCSSKQSLTKHMEQHRVKDEKMESPEKSRRNDTERGLRQPSSRIDEKNEEETENDENSDFESGLDWPMDNHECPTCKKKYSTKKSLLRHQLLHEEPNFECDICNVKFYRKDKLKSHYDKCSEKNPDQVRKCNICGDSFENNEILKEHKNRHVDEGILTEEDLRDIEPGFEERRESRKVARKRRDDIVGLECTECNKRYTSRKGLLRHIQVHEGKKYLCDICPKKFYRREHLKIHVAKHNMIKPYKCPRCTKRFIKEEQLSNHLSKHDRTFKKPKEADTAKRFLCEICSKSFTQSTTLIAHLRAHNGIKPYVCEVCARPFTTNAYLKMHMRTHTQERPYSCQYCSRAFARADTLANHLTSHTGEAKYHCKYCPKNFRRLKSLKEHVFIHTGQRPYACPTCDRRFNNNGSRYAHSKRCKQNVMQSQNRQQAGHVTGAILQNTMAQPIRLHQFTGQEHSSQMQVVKSQSIKTITIARQSDQLTGHQVMQHQEILMPLILPLTVTLTDVDEEVILPEGTKIFTTA